MSILCSIHQLSLVYPEKICFEQFDANVYSCQRIAVVGNNGCGKTSLLRMLAGIVPVIDGNIRFHQQVEVDYVPQIPEHFDGLSGSEHFQKALSQALASQPELLILDEPTNHLDVDNKKNLLQFLQYYPGTLIVASHDSQLLSTLPDCLWSINHGKVELFDGQYKDFLQRREMQYAKLTQQLASLEKDKRAVHNQLMKEQTRAKSAKEMGKKSIQKRKWPTIVSHAKMHRASMTSGKKGKKLSDKRQEVLAQINALDRPELIEPKFHLSAGVLTDKSVVTIKDGRIGYPEKKLPHEINFQLSAQARIAIMGKNGSGKSTFIKAIMHHSAVLREGDWLVPVPQDIGYLDQNYQQLIDNDTVLSTLERLRPDWCHQQHRSHLNDFLFKSNHVVHQMVSSLSGGEKVRLSLAQIAARPPKLLIADELTNNLDATTRDHVIQCLQAYPGPMIVVSHDEDFLERININEHYHLS